MLALQLWNVLLYILKWHRNCWDCWFLKDCYNPKYCLVLSTVQCPCVTVLPGLGFAFTLTSPTCDPCLANLCSLFSLQIVWVLTSPGYSPSSQTSLPCSTLWTKWSVSVAFVPEILKTMAALVGLKWKGSLWMKLMSKSFPWDYPWHGLVGLVMMSWWLD